MASKFINPDSRDEALIRSLVTEAIRKCSKSREQIAQEMTALLNQPITARMLHNYTSESREEYRFPLQFTRAFCEVLGDWTLLQTIVRRAGFRLIGPDEERLIEIGRAFVARAAANKLLRGAAK